MVAALEAHDIRAVHVGIFDIDTRFRVKRIDTAKFVKLLNQGYEFCEVLYHWDTAELPYGQGAWADASAPIDPGSGRLFPFSEGEAVFIAEFDGKIGDLAPLTLTCGIQNRTGAVRIINSEPDATRVAFRVPVGDANPQLTLSQCLGASWRWPTGSTLGHCPRPFWRNVR